MGEQKKAVRLLTPKSAETYTEWALVPQHLIDDYSFFPGRAFFHQNNDPLKQHGVEA